MKLRQAMAAMLAAEGVEVLFGLMGDGNMLLVLDAVETYGIRFVNARHETAAVLMADAYARVTGRPAAVTVTHGPGLAAAGLGIGVAQGANTPLLIIVGDTDRSQPLHVQRFDQETFANALVDDVVALHTSRGALPTLSRAFDRLHAGIGPVVLSVAVDVQDEEIGDFTARPRPPALPSARLVADPGAVAALVALLGNARRPVLLAGRGARHAIEPLARLAGQTHALLGTTVPARGLFEGHPHNLGVLGGLSTASTREIVADADLIVGFGTSLTRFTTDFGQLAPQARWVLVNRQAGAPALPQVEVAYRVQGDAAEVATLLTHALSAGAGDAGQALTGRAADAGQAFLSRAPDIGLPLDASAAEMAVSGSVAPSQAPPARWDFAGLPARRAQVEQAAAAAAPGFNERGLDPRYVAKLANDVLPADRIEVMGIGHFAGFPSIASRIDRHGLFVAPWEFGSIGVALPIAIGASLARPASMTVAWEGDGSLLASLGELETLGRSGARVV